MRVVIVVMLAGCMAPDVTVLGPGADDGSGGGGTPSAFADAGIGPVSCDAQFQDSAPPVVPVTQPPALSGGTMLVREDGSVVIADSDRDVVWLVQSDLTTVSSVSLKPGDEPGRVVAGEGSRVFVVLRRAGEVAQIDFDARTVIGRYAACATPRGAAWDATTSTLHVACGEGTLVNLGIADTFVSGETSRFIADDLRDVVKVGNELWFTTFRLAKVYALTEKGTVEPLFGPLTTTAITAERFDPHVAWRAVSYGAGILIVHQAASERGTGVEVPTCPVGGYGSSDGSLLDSTSMVHAMLTSVQPGVPTNTTESLTDGLGVAVLPVDVAVSGHKIAIAAAGSQSVFVFNDDAPNTFPHQVFLNGAPVAVGFIGTTAYAFLREPAQLIRVDTTSAPTPLMMPGAVSVSSTGFDLFHLSTNSHIACASCHPEAGDDGNVWTLPEGTFRTPSLRGGISGTAPFHWGGEEHTMATLMFDIFSVRMNGAAETPERVAALADWLDAQPERRAPPQDPAAVVRGAALFSSPATGCTTCHSGALGTNNATMDVGTGMALQVPRLVELGYRAPFLHDGRAPTLEDRFRPVGGGDAHGYTSQLSAQDVSDLVAYLRTR